MTALAPGMCIAFCLFGILGFGVGYYLRQLSHPKHQNETLAKYKSVIEAVPGLVSIFGPDLKYELVNSVVCRYLNLPESEVLGKVLGFKEPSVFADFVLEFKKSPASHQEKRIQVQTHDGLRWFLAAITRLPEGRIVVVSIDINDHVQIEDEIAHQQAWTASHARLAAMGDLAAGIAHEVNNPVAIITAKSEQVIRKMKAKNESEFIPEIEKIRNMGFRVANIVRGLKNLSRNGESDPFSDSRILEIAKDISAILDEKLRYNQIQFKIDIPENLIVPCRATQIGQVMMNLVSNSFDALKGTPDSWIRLEAFVKGAFVEIAVSDSGPGIPAEIQAKLMTPFFTTKGAGNGTGLGLSISRRIAIDHGGEFLYDSKSPNTRFILRLPMNRAEKSVA